MPDIKRTVSHGVELLIPEKLQAYLWRIYEVDSTTPCFFDLKRGQGKHTQTVLQFYLEPYREYRYQMQIALPLKDLRLVIVKEDNTLLLKIRNRNLEELLANRPIDPQGELDF